MNASTLEMHRFPLTFLTVLIKVWRFVDACGLWSIQGTETQRFTHNRHYLLRGKNLEQTQTVGGQPLTWRGGISFWVINSSESITYQPKLSFHSCMSDAICKCKKDSVQENFYWCLQCGEKESVSCLSNPLSDWVCVRMHEKESFRDSLYVRM